MAVSRSDFAGTRRSPGVAQPVGREEEIPPELAEHLESHAAAAERHARTTFGMVDDPSGDLHAHIADDHRSYMVLTTLSGVLAATLIGGMALFAHLKPKAVTVDPMSVISGTRGTAHETQSPNKGNYWAVH